MLEPWIIEEIRRREEEKRRRKEEQDQPRIDIPEIDPEQRRQWEEEEKRRRDKEEDDKPKRGITIINPDGGEERGKLPSDRGVATISFQ